MGEMLKEADHRHRLRSVVDSGDVLSSLTSSSLPRHSRKIRVWVLKELEGDAECQGFPVVITLGTYPTLQTPVC